MSTSILYHAFGLRNVQYKSATFYGKYVIYKAEVKDYSFPCPSCGARKSIFKGRRRRRFHLPPIGRKRCLLDMELRRLGCKVCGKHWFPRLSFMTEKRRYVRSFALLALDLLQFMTVQAVARYLGVGWDLIKTIHKDYLSKKYRTIPLDKVHYLCMDEIAIRKNHHYMTIFYDLSTGRILHAVPGRSQVAIRPFIKKLVRRAPNLEAVAMDMNSAYFQVVLEDLPHIDIVFDRYHVMALMNRALDQLRAAIQREMDILGRRAMKGSRFLFLKNYQNLSDHQKDRLQELFTMNDPLFRAHALKEQLRLLWDISTQKEALSFLEMWCKDAKATKLGPLARVAKTLLFFKKGITNYQKHGITNAIAEGINNKIKTLKRQAYGYRDMEYFLLRLFHLHEQRYSFAG